MLSKTITEQQKSTTVSTQKETSDFSHLPVLLAILPPLLSLYYGGKVEEWNEGFLLVIIAFYLYALVKVPWELYLAARSNFTPKDFVNGTVNDVSYSASTFSAPATASSTGSYGSTSSKAVPVQSSTNKIMLFRLCLLELFYLIIVFASPLSGALFLKYIQTYLKVYKHLISDFPMVLYVLTAYIRPLSHVSKLLEKYTQHVRDQAFYPSSDALLELKSESDALRSELNNLKLQVYELKMETSKRVENTVENVVEPQLKGLNRNLQKSLKKEQKFMDFSMEKFRDLEIRLNEQEVLVRDSVDQIIKKFYLEFRQDSLLSWWIPKTIRSLLFTSPKHYNSITSSATTDTNNNNINNISPCTGVTGNNSNRMVSDEPFNSRSPEKRRRSIPEKYLPDEFSSNVLVGLNETTEQALINDIFNKNNNNKQQQPERPNNNNDI